MFKKILCYFIAVACVSLFWSSNNKPIFSELSDRFEIYTFSDSSTAVIQTVSADEYKLYKNVKGESCVVGETADVDELLTMFNAELKFIEETDGVKSYYAFSKDIKYKKELGGVTVNLQIAVSENMVKIGSPIIFGSF